MPSLIKALFRLLGQIITTVLSFIVVIVALSLFAVGLGIGLGGGWTDNLGTSERTEPDVYVTIEGDTDNPNRLLSVPVAGVILGHPQDGYGGLFGLAGFSFGYEIRQQLLDAAEDASIKGVLIHMQTPGGTIFGSRAILDGIRSYRETTGKPVVVYIEGLAASGGVMAMVGADAIWADYGSFVGSIGVLGPELTYFDNPTATDGGLFGGGIVTEGGIEHTQISAGRGKDLGNPFRRPSFEEIRTLQTGVDNEYAQFVELVAEARGIDAAVIRDEMGAQIFDNQTAEGYGLIDGTRNYEASLQDLAERAAVDSYQVVEPALEPTGFWRTFMSRIEGFTDAEPRQPAVHHACLSARSLPLAYFGDPRELCR